MDAQKPIEQFKTTRWGTKVNVCNECVMNKYRANKQSRAEQERTNGLSVYSPRELMQELARRGYEGTLRYVQVKEIDITNF